MDQAVRYLSIIFVPMLKKGGKNIMYTLEDSEPLQFPHIWSLIQFNGTRRPYVSSELVDDIMADFNIEKPIPSPLEVVKVEDASISHSGRTTTG